MVLVNENAREYMEYRGWKGKRGIVKLIIRQLRIHFLLRLGQVLPHSNLRVKCFKLMGVNIKENVFIGLDVILDPLYPELITIENYAEIGDRACIYTHSRGTKPMKLLYPRILGKVRIGRGAWLGAPNVVVLPGVKIGDYSIVAAGAVVTKDVSDYCVVAGVPAKEIKKIDPEKVLEK